MWKFYNWFDLIWLPFESNLIKLVSTSESKTLTVPWWEAFELSQTNNVEIKIIIIIIYTLLLLLSSLLLLLLS